MQAHDHDYIKARHAQSLKMAAESTDTCAAAVHRKMAKLYGRRLADVKGAMAATLAAAG